MGFTATKWAMDMDIPNPCAKSLLTAIASFADDKGVCWPSYRKLSERSGLAYSTVAKYMRLLKHFGFLQVKAMYRPADGGRTSSHIFLAVDKTKGALLWLLGRKSNHLKPSSAPPPLPCSRPHIYMVEDMNLSEELVKKSLSKGSLKGEYTGPVPPVIGSEDDFSISDFILSRWAPHVNPPKVVKDMKGVQFA